MIVCVISVIYLCQNNVEKYLRKVLINKKANHILKFMRLVRLMLEERLRQINFKNLFYDYAVINLNYEI